MSLPTDEFDAVLRRVMQARPEALEIPPLAQRAMRRAYRRSGETLPAFQGRLVTYLRWRFVSSVTLAVLSAVLIAVCAWGARHIVYLFGTSSSDVQVAAGNASMEVSSLYGHSNIAVAGGLLLISTIGLLVLSKAFSRNVYPMHLWRAS